jgi:hypothetical protein
LPGTDAAKPNRKLNGKPGDIGRLLKTEEGSGRG